LPGPAVRLLTALCALMAVFPAGPAHPGPSVPRPGPGVLLILVPGLTLDDVKELPGLRRLAREGCSALMSSRIGRPVSVPLVPADFDPLLSGYLTLASGSRAACGDAAALILQDSERVSGRTALQVWEQRTGGRGEGYTLFAPEFQAEVRRARAAPYPLEPGALGSHLAARGISACILGNADLPDVRLRPAALFLLEKTGRARSGIVDSRMTLRDPAFPYGLRTDTAAMLKAVADCLPQHRFIVVETGDAFRYARYEAETLPGARAALRRRVMQSVDSLVSGCAALLPEGWRLVVASPGQLSDEEDPGASSLAPLLSYRNGEGPGLLTSGSTRRPGVVANTDLATAIAHWLGAPGRIGGGQPIEAVRSASPLPGLDAIRAEAERQSRSRGAVRVFVYASSLALAAAAALACSGAARERLAAALALAPAAALTGLLAAGAVKPPVAAGAETGAIAAALAFAAFRLRKTRLPVAPWLALLSVAAVGSFCALGRLAGAPASYEVQGGARYYGLGNEYGGLFAGAAALLAGTLTARGVAGTVAGALLMLAAAVFAGHPGLGANAGVMLGCLAGLAAVLGSGLPRRRWPAALAALSAGGAVLAGLAVADSFRPESQQSHFGRAIAGIRQDGAQAALDIVLRKAGLNLTLLQRSPWALLLAASAGGAAFTGRRLRRATPAAGALWATAAALLAFNDSGVLAAAAASLWILPALLDGDNPAEKTLKKVG